jgi:histone-lysine N-methyltransferase SETMAR
VSGARTQFRACYHGRRVVVFSVLSKRLSLGRISRQLPVRVKPTIDGEKCLISVLWSVNGIQSLRDIPKGETFNSAFFCDVALPSLIGNSCSLSRRRSLKGLDVHLENAHPHNSRQPSHCPRAMRARRMAQPAYSPALAPSDFFLFGFLKQSIQGVHFPYRDTLKSTICLI